MGTSSTENPKAGKSGKAPSAVELEAVAVNVDKLGPVGSDMPECSSELGVPSDFVLSGAGSADSLKGSGEGEKGGKGAGTGGCWARYRQRVRESRKWKLITCCWVTLLVTAVLLIILVPIIYCVVIPAIANSSVGSSKLAVTNMFLGEEDLKQGTLATRIQGNITGMPSFEVTTGTAQARLYTEDGHHFATMDLPVMMAKNGKIDMDVNSMMRMTNRTAFDTLAQRMIRELPGVVRMRAEKVPVTVKLGPFKISVYGGVTIDKLTEFAGLRGMNNVEVSDTVVLEDAGPQWLRIAMDVALPNPSTTVATAQNGIELVLMAAATNETLGMVRIQPFTLRTGKTQIKALTDILYTNSSSSNIAPATPRSLFAKDNTAAVRDFLSAYMSGKDVALRLQGPDVSGWDNATYVQRALTNWTTDIALAAQKSASFVTGTRVTTVDLFKQVGKVNLAVEITATNPFDLPVTVRDVNIAIRMNDQDVGVIAYEQNGVIPAKGNITLSGLETVIDIGNFLGEVFSDVGDWFNSVFTGKGTIVVGNVDMVGYIKVALNDAFPVFLPIESRNLTLSQLTDPNALMPSGR